MGLSFGVRCIKRLIRSSASASWMSSQSGSLSAARSFCLTAASAEQSIRVQEKLLTGVSASRDATALLNAEIPHQSGLQQAAALPACGTELRQEHRSLLRMSSPSATFQGP